MPNNTHIQPPSFSDFSNPPTDNTVRQNTELKESTNKIYDLPLSVVNHTDSVWFTTFSWALGISAIMFTIILYALFRVIQIRLAEREEFMDAPRSPQAELILGHKSEGMKPGATSTEIKARQRWQQIEEHLVAGTTSDWRLAILEADIILDDLITSMGYSGEGLGEKLKQINPGDLNFVESAWEAHKIRNKIAHEGAAHELNEREVKRVLNLYKQVFQEVNLI